MARLLEEVFKASGWNAFSCMEDWGWAVCLEKDSYDYMLGIYCYSCGFDEALEARFRETGIGEWCVRLNKVKDRRDKRPLVLRMLSPKPLVSDDEVTTEVKSIFERLEDLQDLQYKCPY